LNARSLLLFSWCSVGLASCGPRWTLEGRTPGDSVTLDAGSTHSRTFAVEASHPIATVRTVAQDISRPSGKLRIDQTDTRDGCSASRDFEGRERKWNPVPASGTVSLTDDRVELSAPCPSTKHTTTIRVTLTNGGAEPLTLRWFVVAVANGDGSEDPPSDAFVRVRPEPE
jgi:hypothetical protein